MNEVITKIFVSIFFLTTAATIVIGQENSSKEISVLLTYGGHDFEQKPFFEMFDKLVGVNYTCVQLPDSANLLKPGLEKKYDVIVMYDMVRAITAEQRTAFIELLKRGIGVVALHHNLGAHRDWDEYMNIIGGKYVFEPEMLGGKKQCKSDYAHDQDFVVKVADKNHPITQGISDFKIHDETYKNYYTLPDVHVLLTTDFPTSDPEIAWVTQYGKSPVFYLLLGHDSKAWTNPNYPKLLLNGIRWTAGESK